MGHSPPRIVSLAEGPAAANAAYAFQCMGIEPIAAPLPTPLKPVDCIAYVEQLSPVCDVLVLPLGLCAGMSLDIAREVHRQESGIRTVLFTGSLTATADTATPLFDYIRCSRSSGLHIVLKQAWCEPVPPRQGREAVERQIATLIDTEHCFRQLRPVPLSLMRVDVASVPCAPSNRKHP